MRDNKLVYTTESTERHRGADSEVCIIDKNATGQRLSFGSIPVAIQTKQTFQTV
jgi:hypothetical protein